jgi:hypothetical protein
MFIIVKDTHESALTAESSQWNLTGNDQPTLVHLSLRLLHN